MGERRDGSEAGPGGELSGAVIPAPDTRTLETCDGNGLEPARREDMEAPFVDRDELASRRLLVLARFFVLDLHPPAPGVLPYGLCGRKPAARRGILRASDV